jgi:DNA-binding MarR family transcriptional regulator
MSAMRKLTKQKRLELGAMEYFILTLIGRAKLTSLYEFQQKAGLQPGGIRQALVRLERRGLITRAASATRRRRELALTNVGFDVLYQSWRECLHDNLETESVIRVACIALFMGGPEDAATYLERQAGLRKSIAWEKEMETERLQKSQKDPLSTYAWMRTLTEARRRSAEGEALSGLGLYLKEHQQPNDVRNR